MARKAKVASNEKRKKMSKKHLPLRIELRKKVKDSRKDDLSFLSNLLSTLLSMISNEYLPTLNYLCVTGLRQSVHVCMIDIETVVFTPCL